MILSIVLAFCNDECSAKSNSTGVVLIPFVVAHKNIGEFGGQTRYGSIRELLAASRRIHCKERSEPPMKGASAIKATLMQSAIRENILINRLDFSC